MINYNTQEKNSKRGKNGPGVFGRGHRRRPGWFCLSQVWAFFIVKWWRGKRGQKFETCTKQPRGDRVMGDSAPRAQQCEAKGNGRDH